MSSQEHYVTFFQWTQCRNITWVKFAQDSFGYQPKGGKPRGLSQLRLSEVSMDSLGQYSNSPSTKIRLSCDVFAPSYYAVKRGQNIVYVLLRMFQRGQLRVLPVDDNCLLAPASLWCDFLLRGTCTYFLERSQLKNVILKRLICLQAMNFSCLTLPFQTKIRLKMLQLEAANKIYLENKTFLKQFQRLHKQYITQMTKKYFKIQRNQKGLN